MSGGASLGALGQAAASAAWRDLVASGQLPRMYRYIVEAIGIRGPMTGTECYADIEARHGIKLNYNTRTRFGELRDKGVLREAGLRVCRITGRSVIVWDLGDGVPPEKKRERCPTCGQTRSVAP